MIGRGSFKQVFRGRWHNQHVAIQRLRQRDCPDIEPELMTVIGRHAHLLHFFGKAEDAEYVYLITELSPLAPHAGLDHILSTLDDIPPLVALEIAHQVGVFFFI